MLFMPDGYDRDDLLIGVNFVEDSKLPNFQFSARNRIGAQVPAAVGFDIRVVNQLYSHLD